MRIVRLSGLYPPFGGARAADLPPPPPPERLYPALVRGRPMPRPGLVAAAWTRSRDR